MVRLADSVNPTFKQALAWDFDAGLTPHRPPLLLTGVAARKVRSVMPFKPLTLWLVLVCYGSFAVAAPPEEFQFQDGDRIVLLGGTFIEREIHHGYLETALTSALPEMKLTFRNLGWQDDTVWAEARSRFHPPTDGYRRMLALVHQLKPTVVMLAYGTQESFAGETGVEPFVKQYEKLLDDLAPLDARLVLIAPHQFETPSAPWPDASPQNPMLGRYAQAIRDVAERRGGWLIDLYDSTAAMTWPPGNSTTDSDLNLDPPRGFHLRDGVCQSLPLTGDGVQLSPYGSLRVARMIVHQLKLPKAEFLMQLDSEGKPESSTHAAISGYAFDGTAAKFQLQLSRLPEPPTPLFPTDVEYFLVAGGVPSGRYEVKIDGKFVTANSTNLTNFPIRAGADFEQAERLRRAIVAKNRLCLHPRQAQHAATLGRFCMQKQKNDAVEINSLVAEAEEKIVRLKCPSAHTFEIAPRTEASEK